MSRKVDDQEKFKEHWSGVATATPLEDFRKFREEAEAELMGLNTTSLSPERLATSTAMVAALGQDIPSPVQRPKKRSRWARRRKSPWINDATVGMLGRGWKP